MNHQANQEQRTLTLLDYTRVSRLLCGKGAAPPPAAESMRDMLDSSELVPSPSVPPSVVTMYSRVLLEDPRDAARLEITLCYPPDADASLGKVSVLSPAGAALLGLCMGAVARWRTPTGEERAARILSILFQPEAAGDYLR
jgi:regulator of nucleoside diphosphate kinase